jgi:hypothetical protein
MSVSLAFQKSSVTLAQAQTTYKQNLLAVNTTMVTVASSTLPALVDPPADWNDFYTALTQAKTQALGWVNGVLANLLDVPLEIQKDTFISEILTYATQQATILVKDPTNQLAQQSLSNYLNQLPMQFQLVTSYVNAAITNTETFQSNLPSLATQLQALAAKASTDSAADQTEIDTLNADIQRLQNDVSNLTQQAVDAGLVAGAAMIVGRVIPASWATPTGALFKLLCGIVAAVALYEVGLDIAAIATDESAISSDEQQISGYTSDIATLNVLATTFNGFVTQTQGISGNLQAVLAEWQTLQNEVNAAVTDMQAAIADTSSANFQAVLTDLQNATNEWNAAYTQAGTLQVNIQANTAVLTPGMSAEQVQGALAQGQTTDIITFFNTAQTTESTAQVELAVAA